MLKKFDCVIIGGGMIGAASALSLANLGLTVALVEKNKPTKFASSQPLDLRVSAISLASERLLTQLAVWSSIKSWRTCPYKRLGVWENELAYTEFNSDDIAQPHLGHIVENRLIQLALWQALEVHANITLFCPEMLKSFHRDSTTQLITIKLTDNQFETRLLIGADGANSQVRKLANIGITGWDYQQSAMLMNVETEHVEDNITWQHFLPTGPVAFLPLAGKSKLGGYASLVWYQHSDEIKKLLALPNKQLTLAIKANFPKRLGNINVLAKGAFPLTRRHANTYVQQNIVLLGDAAHTINPLAGQGVNLGFKDVLALQMVIAEAIGSGHAWFNEEVLANYQQQRRKDNLLMMSAMDSFYQAFSHPSPFVKLLRNSAFFLVDKIKPIKNQVLKHACGID
jgi:2-octaprenyl-3-methyl-6-methoxy-1,4-benzoquinol hydroxylase